jgi:hypothetical protein
MFKRRLKLSSFVVWLVAVIGAVSAQAATVVNGNFETGSLLGWRHNSNNAGPVTASFGVGPLGGAVSALLVARDSGFNSCVVDPWNARCVPQPVTFPNMGVVGVALAHDLPDPIRLGAIGLQPDLLGLSSIGQDVVLAAGDKILVDWRFLTNDGFGCCNGDNGILLMTNGTTLVGVNASSFVGSSGVAPSSTGFQRLNSLLPASITAPTAGTWTLYVGVFHGAGDTLGSSGMIVDNIRIQAVPEPSALLMCIMGMAALWQTARRKHNKVVRGELPLQQPSA